MICIYIYIHIHIHVWNRLVVKHPSSTILPFPTIPCFETVLFRCQEHPMMLVACDPALPRGDLTDLSLVSTPTKSGPLIGVNPLHPLWFLGVFNVKGKGLRAFSIYDFCFFYHSIAQKNQWLMHAISRRPISWPV